MPPKTFAFVDHSDSRKVALRSIRSHITRQQHENRRQRARQAQQGDSDSRSVSSSSTSSSSCSTATPASTKDHILTQDYYEEFLAQQKSTKVPTRKQQPKKKNRVVVQPREPVKTDILSFNIGPLALEPVPRKDWYAYLTNYWYSGTMPRSAKLLKTTPARIEEYTIWSRRLEMTEPALYYMHLLLASGIPVSNGNFPLGKALWLRGQAIQAINEALSDPVRATSVALIVAVGQMALHEHIYGDRTAAHQSHRPAQQHMIALRGGIEHLNLPSIVVQVMVWYDKLMASEANNTAYFADLPQRMKEIQAYNEEEAQNVTNVSSPKRYQHPGYHVTEGPVDSELQDDND